MVTKVNFPLIVIAIALFFVATPTAEAYTRVPVYINTAGLLTEYTFPGWTATTSDIMMMTDGSYWNTDVTFPGVIDLDDIEVSWLYVGGTNATATMYIADDGTIPFCGTPPAVDESCWDTNANYKIEFYKVNNLWYPIAGTASSSPLCTTCTRIVYTDPANESYNATSTSKLITTQVYIAEEDWDDEYSYYVKYYYYPQATYSEANIVGSTLAQFSEFNETELINYGTSTTAFLASKLNVVGIYNYEIDIYRRKEGFISNILNIFIDYGEERYTKWNGYYTMGSTTDYEALKNARNLGEQIVDRLAGCNPFDFTNLEMTVSWFKKFNEHLNW